MCIRDRLEVRQGAPSRIGRADGGGPEQAALVLSQGLSQWLRPHTYTRAHTCSLPPTDRASAAEERGANATCRMQVRSTIASRIERPTHERRRSVP
eukprot:15457657-Alexandrium_andersonii.AAC.1